MIVIGTLVILLAGLAVTALRGGGRLRGPAGGGGQWAGLPRD